MSLLQSFEVELELLLLVLELLLELNFFCFYPSLFILALLLLLAFFFHLLILALLLMFVISGLLVLILLVLALASQFFGPLLNAFELQPLVLLVTTLGLLAPFFFFSRGFSSSGSSISLACSMAPAIKES